MSRPNPFTLALLMAAILAVATGLGLLKGALYPTWHEADLLHMAQIVEREAAGEWPHLDFMTPLGVLAYAPITLFVRQGFTLAEAFVLGQGLVGALLLPAAMWAGFSRLSQAAAYLFGAGMMIMCVALVPAHAAPGISLSMSYNRWGWAIGFTVLLVAVVPHRGRGWSPMVDGMILGLGLAALALIKMTYFVAFLPAVLLSLWIRRDRRGAALAAGSGIAVVLAVTAMAGIGIWPAYLGDLLTVARSEVRAFPGESLAVILGGTTGRVGTALLLVVVICLRRVGAMQAGLLLLVAAPGLAYVTFQNHGNEPVWLFFLAALALGASVTQGRDERSGPAQALAVAGWIALALSAPGFMAMAESPLRNFSTDREGMVEMLPGDQGLWEPGGRVLHVQTRVSRPFAATESQDNAGARPEPTYLNGEPLEQCRLLSGLVGWFRGIGEELTEAGFGARRIFVADLLNGYWLYGGGVPLPGGAPWYYGGLPGLEGAEFVLVPQCAARPDVRALILTELEDAGIVLSEADRTDDYILMAITPSLALSTR
ncbi:hypothetical protein [Rhodovulum sp. P5]|uniref:hypothetical protein n=1 Tax=Rhodovulum sp. P5 TaxID=1564506 RepID=UPI0009DA47F1|nr:hypothetical protein [Rhodovulum sp. P5]